MNEAVKRWRHAGRVWLWRYKREKPQEWHLSADREACAALLELIDLLASSEFSGSATVPLSQLPIPVATPEFDPRPAKSLEIHYAPMKLPDAHWAIIAEAGNVRLDVGRDALKSLREAVSNIAVGQGDYALRAGEHRLWIW